MKMLNKKNLGFYLKFISRRRPLWLLVDLRSVMEHAIEYIKISCLYKVNSIAELTQTNLKYCMKCIKFVLFFTDIELIEFVNIIHRINLPEL